VHPRTPWRTSRISFLALVIAFVMSLIVTGTASAHPDGDAHHVSPLPENASAAMRAFEDGHEHGAQALAAAAATPCVDGMAGGFPCSNVDLEAFLPLAGLGASSTEEAQDIWGWTDPATGSEYALVGMTFGTAFVDITSPASPVYLGELQTHGAFGSNWRDIKVDGDHAFIVSEANRHGMQVFDLTQLRGLTGTPPVQFDETAHYREIGNAHNIVINEASDTAFIVGAGGRNGCNGGLHMVDISVPTSPTFAGCFSTDGYTHDAQCVIYDGPDDDHGGQEICLASNEDTLTIVDVTDRANPVQLSRTGYPGASYTHQGWLTEDSRHFLVDDELDETGFGHNTRTRVFDVSNLDAPTLVGFQDGTTTAIDHNQYIVGNLTFQANYRAGLRILDITDVTNANLAEIGYFDVWPADDDAEFNGAWSVYPYYSSGVVVVSGIEQGLFVLRPDVGGSGPTDTAPSVQITRPADGAEVSGTVSVTADASDDFGVTEVEFLVDGVPIVTDTSTPYTASLDSTALADGAVSIEAVATDTIGQTGSDAITVVVDNVAAPSVHVGDLDGSVVSAGRSGKWNATVTIAVHDDGEGPVAGATVVGSFSEGGGVTCTTDPNGVCSVTVNDLRRNTPQTVFSVTDVAGPGPYDSGANHDPDGDSDGTTIVLLAP